MKKNRIHISIAFGDAILPVVECDDGIKRVPLKPIVEQVGAQWKGQSRKVEKGKYLFRRLGIKVTPLKWGDKPHICIRIDRVTAYLNTLNPENIRAMGNHDAADWLESKHTEWDDVLHLYETNGFASKQGSTTNTTIKTLGQIDRIKNPALKHIAAKQANQEMGLEIPIGKQESLEL